MHEATEVAAKHHHVAGDDVIFLTVNPFFPPTLSPHRSIHREAHIPMAGKEVAHVLTAVKICSPCVGISRHLVVLPERTNHLLFSNEEMGAVVMEQVHGRKRSLAVWHEQVGAHPAVSIHVELDLQRFIALALFFVHHFHVPRLGLRGWGEHALQHLRSPSLLPFPERTDAGMFP